MKKIYLVYILLAALFFTACSRSYYKSDDKELVKYNQNNIFN